MMVQCQACKTNFEIDSSKQRGILMPQEKLCAYCLMEHIERLIYGKSRRLEQQNEQIVDQAVKAA